MHIFLSTNQKFVPLTIGSFGIMFVCYALALMPVISVLLLTVVGRTKYAF